MKRVLRSIAAAILTLTMLLNVVVFANEEKEITVVVNGAKIEFDVPPITENYRTLVPMRYIFEALGAAVEWNNDTNTATAVKDDITISITIDNNIMLKNGEQIELDVPARLVNDRTLVPVRAVSEGMGAEVNWIEETQTVIIEDVPEITVGEGATAPVDENDKGTIVGIVSTDKGYTPIEDVLDYTELSDEDMKLLKESVGDIRYTFEQYVLPELTFSSEAEIAGLIKNKDSEAVEYVNDMWLGSAVAMVWRIQAESETQYNFLSEAKEEKILEEMYANILKEAGLAASDMFDISFTNLKDGSTMLLLDFKNTDTLLACKYIALVAQSDNTIRYFTAETDIFDTEHLFVCEIDDMDEARGKTHVLIEKSTDKNGFASVIEEILGK